MTIKYLEPLREMPTKLAKPYWEYRMVRNPYDGILRAEYDCNVCGDTGTYAYLDFCPFCPEHQDGYDEY